MNNKVIRDSFELLSNQVESVSLQFYEELFNRYPSVKPLFEGSTPNQQAKKLASALVLLVNSLDEPDKLSETLLVLGRKHQFYGAEPAHYDAVKEVLLEVIANAAGDAWSDELQQAWEALLGNVAKKMLAGYSETNSNVNLVGKRKMKHTNDNESQIWLQAGTTIATSAVALCALMDITLGRGTWGTAGTVLLLAATGSAAFFGVKLVKNLSALLESESLANSAISNLYRGDYSQHVSDQSIGESSLLEKLDNLRVLMQENQHSSSENSAHTEQDSYYKEMAAKYQLIDKVQAVIEFDTDGNILKANKNFCDTMEYSEDELVGKHHSMFVDVEYTISSEYKKFWENLNRGKIDTGEFKRFGKGGKEVWISASYIPVLDDSGKPKKVVKFATDISDKKLAAKLKEALNVSDANIMVTDEAQNIIYGNESFFKMFENRVAELKAEYPQFDLSNIIGTSITEFSVIPKDDVDQIVTHRDVHKTHMQISHLTFDLVATPIIEEEGGFSGTVYEWNDVTDALAKAEKEQASAAENMRVRSALDSATSNVMLADADNRIIYMNEAVTKMFQDKEDEIRQDLPKFAVENLIGETMDVFHKNANHQQRVVGELTGTRSAIAEVGGISFRIITTAIESEGSRIGTVVEWEDITLELVAEQEAKANARLKQALDSATSNIMLADAENKIIYMNATVVEMFRKAETKIQKALPGFSANDLVGKNMDTFHKDPSHQLGLIKGLTSTYTGEAKVSGLTFQVVANPLMSEKGERIGTFVEWKDRTEEIAVEEEVQSVLQGIASGDLTKLVEGDYEGFFGNLKMYINATVEKLIDVVQQIKEASDSVATGSEEICQGNANLSQRTEQQASSLEETSSSMEEMTSTVQQNAENAREADNLAQGAKDKAEHGGAVVGRAVTAMEEINGASKRIADIISVIDEIAFQTNLLALNASVEAARAGEQGRGFAVVASEVRNLAGRSATAAKEIKELIEDSVGKVEQGSKLVDESGKTLEEIITAVQKVTSIVGEISGASVEQAAGIEEVNKAISLMDEMTQQNAALVEQAAAASEAMGDQAGELKGQMGFFKLNGAAQAASSTTNSDNAKVVEMRRSAPPRSMPSNDPAPATMKAASSASSSEWEEF